jgi:hypothetical protein
LEGYGPVVNASLSAVVDYIRVLTRSLDTTTFPSDRTAYQRHLAAAARLVALLAQDDHAGDVEDWLRDEEHGFGWGYLSGEQGEQAESAFVALKAILTHR